MRNQVRDASAAFLVLAIGAASSRPAFSARPIQGAVGQVSLPDGAELGPVGFRIFSGLPGGTTNVNDNTASCRNVRCLRPYVMNPALSPGGYVSTLESTAINNNIPDQPFYMLVDASMHDDAGNHIAWWGVSGVAASESGIGDPLRAGCPSVNPMNCYSRLDSSFAEPPLTGTSTSYGGPSGTIRAIGGMNPIPNVRIDGYTGANVNLSWIDPPIYFSAMRPTNTAPAPQSPVKGVRLWRNDRMGSCTAPTGSDPGWVPVGAFDLGSTSTQVPLDPSSACTFFALTVRLIGGGWAPNEIETGHDGASHFVGVNSLPATLNCNDNNPCTVDWLGPNGCESEIALECDDDDPCTINDLCSMAEMRCFGTPAPDGDGDGRRNTCDNCATVANPDQANFDGDALGDLCDPDDDNDGAADPSDCAPRNASAFALAGEVQNLRYRADKVTLEWDSAAPGSGTGTFHQVMSGALDQLPVGSGAGESCLALFESGTTESDVSFPFQGQGFWYLVRGKNDCGAGPYGTQSNGTPRISGTCP